MLHPALRLSQDNWYGKKLVLFPLIGLLREARKIMRPAHNFPGTNSQVRICHPPLSNHTPNKPPFEL